MQEVISVVDCCFLPFRLTLAEAAEAGAVTHTVLISELLNHCTEQPSIHKRIYDIMPSSTGWDVKCEASDVVNRNTWSSVILILFHVPGAFTSELLRDLQKGKSELKSFADVHGMLVFFCGCEASINGGIYLTVASQPVYLRTSHLACKPNCPEDSETFQSVQWNFSQAFGVNQPAGIGRP